MHADDSDITSTKDSPTESPSKNPPLPTKKFRGEDIIQFPRTIIEDNAQYFGGKEVYRIRLYWHDVTCFIEEYMHVAGTQQHQSYTDAVNRILHDELDDLVYIGDNNISVCHGEETISGRARACAEMIVWRTYRMLGPIILHSIEVGAPGDNLLIAYER